MEDDQLTVIASRCIYQQDSELDNKKESYRFYSEEVKNGPNNKEYLLKIFLGKVPQATVKIL